MDAKFNNFAVPPGVFIQEELDERGWSQTDLAYILGIHPQGVNQIISGKRGISADMAKALGDAFGTSADLFANLQKSYELSRAHDPDPAIARRGRVQSKYPLREMIKRGWIADASADMMELQLARFFSVASIDDVPHLEYAAKKSHYDEVPPAQLAWLFRVRHIAREMVAPKYSQDKLRKALTVMKRWLANVEDARQVPSVLLEAGVRFVVSEGLPGSKIDGVCFWLDKDSPVIGMSLRFDRVDNFWFVLAHECAHVLHGHGMSQEIIDVELEKQDGIDAEEKLANSDAAEFCVPQDKMNSFYARKNPFFSERDVAAFATRMGVHIGIIVGQLQRRMGRYDFLRKHQARIREHLSIATLADGWGDVVPVEL
ncbi:MULTISPECIES: HigA family addiction module antitoxin [unclassified Mesorhizobium]|uniref:HigA family addiction module antitoxin n=1 Tax=unclassified Mesorhizobium TaxID=325217 RepID=UPI00333A3638